MNYYERHIGDWIKDTISLDAMEEGIYSRLIDQYYQTELPLPVDVKEVYKLARVTKKAERDATDRVLKKFFEKTLQGFVQKRAQEEIEKFWEKDADKEVSKDNDRVRQQRARERRKALFEALSEHGIVPAYNTKTRELRDLLSRVTGRDDNENVTQNVTRDNTANQTPDTSHQSPDASKNIGLTTPSDNSTVVGPQQPASAGCSPGDISKVMRAAGVQSQPADPRIIALSQQGVSIDTVKAACTEAKRSKPGENLGVGYVAAIIQRWAKEAAAIHAQGARPPSELQRQSREEQNRLANEEARRIILGNKGKGEVIDV